RAGDRLPGGIGGRPPGDRRRLRRRPRRRPGRRDGPDRRRHPPRTRRPGPDPPPERPRGRGPDGRPGPHTGPPGVGLGPHRGPARRTAPALSRARRRGTLGTLRERGTATPRAFAGRLL